jgi:5'-nucleotidase
MEILLTNDDGIDAPGLWAVARAVQKAGKVIIVAPREEQSGVGSCITLRHPIEVTRVSSQLRGVDAYSADGTPADCIIIAVRFLFPHKLDLVISGANRGPNLGYDVFVSGTVAAAIQAYLQGISSLAISVNGYEDLRFEAAARIAALLAEKVKEGILPRGTLLNVNLPNLPLERIAGIEITRLSKQGYSDTVQQIQETHYQIVRNTESGDDHPGSDMWAVRHNKISITPLSFGLDRSLSNPLSSDLERLAPILFQGLSAYHRKPGWPM